MGKFMEFLDFIGFMLIVAVFVLGVIFVQLALIHGIIYLWGAL